MKKRYWRILLMLMVLCFLPGCDRPKLYKKVDIVAIYEGVNDSNAIIFLPWGGGYRSPFHLGDHDYDISHLKPGDIVEIKMDYWNDFHARYYVIKKVRNMDVVTDKYLETPQKDIIKVNSKMVFKNETYGDDSAYYMLYEKTGDIVLIYRNFDTEVYDIVINGVKKYSFAHKYFPIIDNCFYNYFADRELSDEELFERIEDGDESIFFMGIEKRGS